MPSGIYVIENRANGKVYVGSAVDFSKRWVRHRHLLNKKKRHSAKLQNAWNKHGASSFAFKRLLVCSKEMLLFYEQRALDSFGSSTQGYNVAAKSGSPLGVHHSLATKAKMSTAHTGRVKTPEHLGKIAEAQKGVPKPQETKDKMSFAHKGVPLSEKHKAALSAARKGNKNRRGHRHTAEIQQQIATKMLSNTNAKKKKLTT